MDAYKLKFTRLQNEILRFLFIKSGESFNQRSIALSLGVSPTAVSNALELLEKENLVIRSEEEVKVTEPGLSERQKIAVDNYQVMT